MRHWSTTTVDKVEISNIEVIWQSVKEWTQVNSVTQAHALMFSIASWNPHKGQPNWLWKKDGHIWQLHTLDIPMMEGYTLNRTGFTPPHGMGPPPLPPYLMHFAHATVAKLTFPYFCMHAAVAKRTFSFCWMNPLAGFGGSIARNCCAAIWAKKEFFPPLGWWTSPSGPGPYRETPQIHRWRRVILRFSGSWKL